jgi:hypothetical protein
MPYRFNFFPIQNDANTASRDCEVGIVTDVDQKRLKQTSKLSPGGITVTSWIINWPDFSY